MSRIFALVTVGTVLFVGAAALGSATENSGSNSELMTDMVGIFGSGLEIGALVPLVLVIALMFGVLGVLARQ